MTSTTCWLANLREGTVKNLWYVVVAYSAIWTALWLYMVRISQHNKILRQEVRDLQAQIGRGLTK